jgi:hypothetical protein
MVRRSTNHKPKARKIAVVIVRQDQSKKLRLLPKLLIKV